MPVYLQLLNLVAELGKVLALFNQGKYAARGLARESYQADPISVFNSIRTVENLKQRFLNFAQVRLHRTFLRAAGRVVDQEDIVALLGFKTDQHAFNLSSQRSLSL